MKPKLGQQLFYTAPDDSGIKPGPYPSIVTGLTDEGVNIVAFGAGRPCSQVFGVQPHELSEDSNPYRAPVKAKTKSPPGLPPVERKTRAKKVK